MAQFQLRRFNVSTNNANGKKLVSATFQVTFSCNEIKKNRLYSLRVWVNEKDSRIDIHPAGSSENEALWQQKGNADNCPDYLGGQWIKPNGVIVHIVTLRKELACLDDNLAGLKGDTLIGPGAF